MFRTINETNEYVITMITEENRNEIIDQYLEGSLNAEFRFKVEEQLINDPEFRRAMVVQQKMIQNHQRIVSESFLMEPVKLSPQVGLDEVDILPVIGRRPLCYATAALVTLVIVGLFWLL